MFCFFKNLLSFYAFKCKINQVTILHAALKVRTTIVKPSKLIKRCLKRLVIFFIGFSTLETSFLNFPNLVLASLKLILLFLFFVNFYLCNKSIKVAIGLNNGAMNGAKG